MTKLSQICAQMNAYNNSVAYGSECNAWGDFYNDCYSQYGIGPQDDKAHELDVSGDFETYWIDVTKGENSDYAYDTGSRND